MQRSIKLFGLVDAIDLANRSMEHLISMTVIRKMALMMGLKVCRERFGNEQTSKSPAKTERRDFIFSVNCWISQS